MLVGGGVVVAVGVQAAVWVGTAVGTSGSGTCVAVAVTVCSVGVAVGEGLRVVHPANIVHIAKTTASALISLHPLRLGFRVRSGLVPSLEPLPDDIGVCVEGRSRRAV